jgi:hypothetical protein
MAPQVADVAEEHMDIFREVSAPPCVAFATCLNLLRPDGPCLNESQDHSHQKSEKTAERERLCSTGVFKTAGGDLQSTIYNIGPACPFIRVTLHRT